jgi:hypothetical protein
MPNKAFHRIAQKAGFPVNFPFAVKTEKGKGTHEKDMYCWMHCLAALWRIGDC